MAAPHRHLRRYQLPRIPFSNSAHLVSGLVIGTMLRIRGGLVTLW
ncbi:hypothetical protein [Nocardia sp. Root136]|nr:hypothetical protein [Nocardia sp. Root136]